MSEYREIAWNEAVPTISERFYYAYNKRDKPHALAMSQAEEKRELLQSVREEFERLNNRPWVKITAGRYNGTIGRLRHPIAMRVYEAIHGPFRNITTDQVIIDGTTYNGSTGSLEVAGYLVARFANYEAIVSVPGQPSLLKFGKDYSQMRSARPKLLLGYDGPPLFVKGKSHVTPEVFTLKDRYGQEVGVGDLAVVGRSAGGTLLVGNVVEIPRRNAIRIKVIGTEEVASANNLKPEQLLKLDKAVHQTLMLAKLSTL